MSDKLESSEQPKIGAELLRLLVLTSNADNEVVSAAHLLLQRAGWRRSRHSCAGRSD